MTDHKKASHSWWFDSHTSAKRSPWLLSTLSEIEEKTKEMLDLIEEDADSFAQRAEMYYRKRPELISMIQDFYRSYRFLAEQHDLLKSDTGTRNSTHLNSYFSNQSWSQKLWDSTDSLNYLDSDVSEVDDPEPEEEAKEAIEFKLARAEGHSSLSPLLSKLSPVTGTSIQTAVNLSEEPLSNGCNNNAVSFLPISASDILDSKSCDIKIGGLARVDQLKFETPYEDIVSDVMRQRSEVERLKMEKKAMEAELEKKDEEKRDVIRQLSLAVEILKEENGNLKRLIRCSSRSSNILGLKKLKDAFSVNGRLFGFPSRFQSSLVAL